MKQGLGLKLATIFVGTTHSEWILSDEDIPLNAWTHIASTYDGQNIKLYINGELVKTVAATGAISGNSSVTYIGGASIRRFPGIIDEVRISNIARSDDWIKRSRMQYLTEISTTEENI